MIDLHTHTKCSDGTDTSYELLKKAENKKIEYISITDHNTCKAYDELRKINISDYFTGKIIPGVELNTKILGIPIEILGYGIDPNIMNELTKKNYLTAKERNILEMKRLCQKCKEANIEIGEDALENYNDDMYASKYLHQLITKNESNKEIIDEESWKNSNVFYRKYMSNPKTIFYINMDDVLPDFDQAADMVRQAGGLVFIPHIYEYRENSNMILEDILNNHKIDGIECFYTTFTEEQSKYLINLCNEKGLLMSGGSDYHGQFKPNVDIGCGFGNLKIEKEIAINWLETMKTFN